MIHEIYHRESATQHDADIACNLQSPELVLCVSDDWRETPSSERPGKESGKVFNYRGDQYKSDQPVHNATEDKENPYHRYRKELQASRKCTAEYNERRKVCQDGCDCQCKLVSCVSSRINIGSDTDLHYA